MIIILITCFLIASVTTAPLNPLPNQNGPSIVTQASDVIPATSGQIVTQAPDIIPVTRDGQMALRLLMSFL